MVARMKPFVDLEGASGRSYRFQLWRDGEAHRPIAGNYACVREEGGAIAVLGLGVTTDLSRCREALAKLSPPGGAELYTRLNVSRGAREAEHQDLVARYDPAFVSQEV